MVQFVSALLQVFPILEADGQSIYIFLEVRETFQVQSHAVRDLAFPGELTVQEVHDFEFGNVELQYDSYRGLQVKLRCVS